MNKDEQTVYIVDDDKAALDTLVSLLNAVGLVCQTFTSAAEFLAVCNSETSGCVLLDFLMPGMSGVEVHKQLIADDIQLQVIFISGHGDIPMVVQAMRNGAYNFLRKPFREHELLISVKGALELQADMRKKHCERLAFLAKLNTLTEREHEVLDCITAGQSNKLTAQELQISDRTVETYRAHIMEKLEVDSIAQLVRMCTVAETTH